MTLRIKLAQWKHRLLCACSKSYREHDAVIAARNQWQGQCADAERDLGELREHLKLAIAAQENAAAQLIAERALRQAADGRADRYHGELLDSLKSATNWSTKALNRKSMFSEVDAPEVPAEAKPAEPIRPKPFARQVAAQQTHAELQAMLEELRQVGPEFTTQ